MSKAKYGVGDLIMLRDGPLRNARTDGEFRILAVLPDSDGQVQYRVRSEREGFDRRVSSSDIDTDRSGVSRIVVQQTTNAGSKEPWFKPSAIRVRK